MEWLSKKPLYALLLLSEKPARWAAWQVVALLGAMVVGTGLVWARVVPASAAGPVPMPGLVGWVILGLLACSVADWVWLAALPRRGLSFGPVQPPVLGLALVRCLLALVAVPLAAKWTAPALVGLATAQALLWGMLVYGTSSEPFRLKITHLDLPSAKLANPGAAVRMVQLSDLHVERLTRRERALPALVDGLSPDLILFTGDYLNTTYQDDPQAMADLRVLLAQFHAPGGLYGVWGTPEVDLADLLRPLLSERGIVLLEDAAAEVTVCDHRVWLMGVNCTRDLARDSAQLHTLVASAPPGAYRVLLYHTPDLMPQAAAVGVDLYLAGHTHGGQWRLPGFGAILTSSRFWKRYEAGHYQDGNTHLYVSRGLGMEGFGTPRARFFCPPEVVALTLHGPDVG